jgi:hypothetical protein
MLSKTHCDKMIFFRFVTMLYYSYIRSSSLFHRFLWWVVRQCIDAVADQDRRDVPKSRSNKVYIKDEVDKTPSLTGFVLNPTLPNSGSFDNHLINDYGTAASLDSAVATNDHESVSDIGSVAAPGSDDISKDQFEDEFEDELWAAMSLDPNLQV